MGVALHGLQDACAGELARAESCCSCCPREAAEPSDTGDISASDVCLVCDFLATAKPPAQVATDALVLRRRPPRVPIFAKIFVAPEPIDSLSARGPPAINLA
jgi:hypothetical protein